MASARLQARGAHEQPQDPEPVLTGAGEEAAQLLDLPDVLAVDLLAAPARPLGVLRRVVADQLLSLGRRQRRVQRDMDLAAGDGGEGAVGLPAPLLGERAVELVHVPDLELLQRAGTRAPA